MSTLRPLFALAAVFALATALAACGGGDASDKDPQAVIQEATLSGIDSADLDLSLSVAASGKEGGDLDIALSGPFVGEGKGDLPRLDMDAEVKGKLRGDDVDFDGGLVLLPNSAYVNYEGTEYEVDPTTFSFVESAINQTQRQGGAEGEAAGPTACQEAAADLDVASFADGLSNDGTADVGGTSTTKLSGDLDVRGAIDALAELTKEPACKAQLGEAGPLPSPSELREAEDELSRSVKTAHVELYVGEDDIIRKIVAELALAPKKGSGSQNVEISLDLTLTGVNEEQEISPPQGARPLSELFQKLDVNPLELAGALQGGDLEGLLEGLGGSGSPGSGSPGSGGQSSGQSYSECIRGATSAADLQKCAAKL